MSMKSKKKIPLPIFILICGALAFAIYISLSTLVLAIWGDTVTGIVDSYDSRLDDRSTGTNRSRTISKGYYFMLNGKEYKGYVVYNSDEQWSRLSDGETRSEPIRYLSAFPYINKPSALAEFDEMGEIAIIYHILSPIACTFLFLLVINTQKRTKKRKQLRE